FRERGAQNHALIFGEQCGLLDRSVVVELTPHAVSAHEPPRRANSERDADTRRNATAALSADEELVVFISFAREVEELDVHGCRPRKEPRIAFADRRPPP